VLSNSLVRFIGYLSNNEFATRLASLSSKPNTRFYRYICSNYCQTIYCPDNEVHHLLFCSQDQQSLHILHHSPLLQLSCRCEILLNLTFKSRLKTALFSAAYRTQHGSLPKSASNSNWTLYKFVLYCVVLYVRCSSTPEYSVYGTCSHNCSAATCRPR